jgi:hypothetical protein
MKMNKKLLMKNAHRITKKIVKLYGVDYKTQLGISMKYVYNQYKLYAKNEIKNYRRNILLTLDKLVNTDDERFNKYFELYHKYNNLSKNIIQKSYNLKSLNAFMKNSLGNKYVMFDLSRHENYMVKDACKNIQTFLNCR